jgi:hypothetical protein
MVLWLIQFIIKFELFGIWIVLEFDPWLEQSIIIYDVPF